MYTGVINQGPPSSKPSLPCWRDQNISPWPAGETASVTHRRQHSTPLRSQLPRHSFGLLPTKVPTQLLPTKAFPRHTDGTLPIHHSPSVKFSATQRASAVPLQKALDARLAPSFQALPGTWGSDCALYLLLLYSLEFSLPLS